MIAALHRTVVGTLLVVTGVVGCSPAREGLRAQTDHCIAIVPRFDDANGSAELRKLIEGNAKIASSILCDPDFLARVRAHPRFAYTKDSPEAVAQARPRGYSAW